MTDHQAVIRPARPEDADPVLELWTEAYIASPAGGRTRPYTQAEFSEAARSGQMFVAERAGEVVGVVVLYPPGAAGRVAARLDEAELARLAIAPNARREGLGRTLTRHCEERANAAGWRAIALWSRPAQTEAHGLYRSLGYRRVPRRDSSDEGGDRLVFRHTLEP